MPATAAKTVAPAKPSLTLKRRFDAPPALVFRAWTQPKDMMRWLGTRDSQMLDAEADLRVGGRYRFAFRTPDGETHDVGGQYQTVDPHDRLAFSWAWHSTPDRVSLVTLSFRPDGEGTLFTLHHEQFFDETARDNHMRGWTETLERLGEFLAEPPR